MKNKWNWMALRLGKKLLLLHRWQGWLFVVLALTGILLSIGTIRGELGAGRIWLKQLHIAGGVGISFLLILYLPLLAKHWKTLKKSPAQRSNLSVILFFLIGWIVSGLILTFYRIFPPVVTNPATLIHGWFSWVGIPYIMYHSISRLRWVKKSSVQPMFQEEKGSSLPPIIGKSMISRRQFIRLSSGAGLAILTLALFGRWMDPFSKFKAEGEIASSMVPQPVPLPASVQATGSKGDFRVYTVTDIPTIDTASFSFTIDGLVDRPITLNWKEFLNLKREVQVSDFHCVTGWSVFNNTWEGIKLKDLLNQAGVQSPATHVKFYSGDKVYTDSLTLEQANLDDIMVAVLHDGKPLPQDLGGPIRLIVPKMYAYKSVKWLERIELVDYQHVGFWQERGYDIDAWV